MTQSQGLPVDMLPAVAQLLKDAEEGKPINVENLPDAWAIAIRAYVERQQSDQLSDDDRIRAQS